MRQTFTTSINYHSLKREILVLETWLYQIAMRKERITHWKDYLVLKKINGIFKEVGCLNFTNLKLIKEFCCFFFQQVIKKADESDFNLLIDGWFLKNPFTVNSLLAKTRKESGEHSDVKIYWIWISCHLYFMILQSKIWCMCSRIYI